MGKQARQEYEDRNGGQKQSAIDGIIYRRVAVVDVGTEGQAEAEMGLSLSRT